MIKLMIIKRRILYILPIVFTFFSSLKNIRKINTLVADVVFLGGDDDRPLIFEGKWYSPLLDTVRTDFENRGYKCASLAHPMSLLLGNSTYGNVQSFDFLLVYYSLCNIKHIFNYKNFKKAVLTAYYIKLITLYKPKLIISIGTPSELAEVCVSCHTEIAELLHAMGYDRIEWGWANRSKNELPNYILSLDKTSTKTFSTLNNYGVEIIEIPHPFLSKYIDSFNGNFECDLSFRLTKKVNILICLQWGYGGEYDWFKGILPNAVYPNVLEEIIAETKDTIDWKFRFHPMQMVKSKYKSQRDMLGELCKKYKNVEYVQSSAKPLPKLLTEVNACITMSSMSVYEAACFGIQSLTLCPTLLPGGHYETLFEDLVQCGYVTKGKIEKDFIINWIKECKNIVPFGINAENNASYQKFINRFKLD